MAKRFLPPDGADSHSGSLCRLCRCLLRNNACAVRAESLRSIRCFRGGAVHKSVSLRWNSPDPSGLVVAGGNDAGAIRAELRAGHVVLVAKRFSNRSAGGCVPLPRGFVCAGGDDAGTIRTELRCSLRRHGLAVLPTGFAGGGIPKSPRGHGSSLAVTMRVPSELNCALNTEPLCRSGSPMGWPVSASQIRAVQSPMAADQLPCHPG